jgi:SAM-dependent methyltransferase
MLWIISGPSSVGKSTFLTRSRCAAVTGLPAGTPVVWPTAQARLDELGSADAFYHYNILREEARGPAGFARDASWRNLVQREVPKRAIILVANKHVLIQRMRQRLIIEHATLTGHGETSYPVQHWIDCLERVDLAAVYAAWRQELRDHGIPYQLLSSEDDMYRPIADEESLPELVNGRAAADSGAGNAGEQGETTPVPAKGDNSGYTQEDIVELLRTRRFAYQRVELPFGLHTEGEDRGQTRDIVLPQSLAGKSVLDVGSAIGYFCFEAEARGATRVVGVELREDRYQDALLLKEIKGSDAEFLRRDVLLDPLTEQFDVVLLLNVIHHLKEPFRALRQLASITRERFVIEFPTFDDAKFRKTARVAFPRQYNRLPLVGVSSMAPDVDQTFVFAPAAIERVLLDHEPLFSRIEFHASPMPGRVIAICHK